MTEKLTEDGSPSTPCFGISVLQCANWIEDGGIKEKRDKEILKTPIFCTNLS